MSLEAPAFVGREVEVARLDGALSEVMEGRGRLVLMGGEAGIGKTRLTDEFAARARTAGAAVLWGRCWEAGGAPPFWPWVECLRTYAESHDPEELRADLGERGPEIAQMVPEIRRIVGDAAEPGAGDPEAARFRLFDAVAGLLRNAGSRAPLVVVLEDLHSADEPSLLLLRFVARSLPRARVMVLATYRDTDVSPDHPLTPTLTELGREPAVRRLMLDGLTLESVAGFVEAVAGREPAPELVEALYRETEGNPLFVSEVVRMLAGEGRLDAPPDTAPWTSLIPPGIREVIDRRLNRLSERCLLVLTRGSAVGRDFSIEVVQRLDGMARTDLLAALDEAVGARVVVEGPAGLGWMRFSHQLVRDALYEGIPPGERADLHRRVAQALLEIHGSDPVPVLTELAHHFYEAAPRGEASMAVRWCMSAGEQAAAVLAYEEAIRLYGMALRALDLASDVDDSVRSEVLLGLGDSRARAGDIAGAKEAFVTAADFAERRGLARDLARAALGYGGRFVWARAAQDRRLVPLLERALAALADADEGLRARLLARLAGALRDEFDPGPRRELSRQAVEVARRLGDPRTLAYVLDGRWAAIWGPDTTDERLVLSAELINAAEAGGDGERAFQGHHYRMICFLERGDVDGARQELAMKERIAGELRQPAQRWYLSASRALFAIFEGRLIEGEELAEQALAIGERAYSSWDARFTHLVQVFLIRREQGRLRELEAALRASIDEYEGSYPFVRAVAALALAEIGKDDEAAGVIDGLVDQHGVHLPRDNEWVFGMTKLAEVVATLREGDRAAILYEALAPYAGRNAIAPIEAMTGAVDRPLGLLAATLGRTAEADRHFSDAFELNRRMRAEPAAARTLLDQARVLSSGNGRDLDRAVELLTDAAAIGRRIRADAIVAGAETLLRKLGHEPPAAERVTGTFMFTDIVGSTALLDAIGDDGWQDLRGWHDRALRELFSEHGGEEVDHAGDGFFVAFAGSRQALDCAVAIQRRLAEHRRTHGFAPRVRIGLHAGEATRSDGGFVGRTVHIAARIGSLADGGQILASASVLLDAGDRGDELERRRVSLKGIADPVEIAAVAWRS